MQASKTKPANSQQDRQTRTKNLPFKGDWK
jgi:hypothetical protein